MQFKRLIRIAIFTTPLLAIYGIAPLFIVGSINLQLIAVAFIALIVLVFSFWLINIYLTSVSLSVSIRYLFSYTLTSLVHAMSFFVFVTPPKELAAPNFLFYPLVSTFACNSIILWLINSEWLKWRNDIAERELQKLKVAYLEAQRLTLLQQLHPHFLFNALTTLKSLIKKNPDGAQDYSVKLSDFLRYSIEAHNTELVSVRDELKFTKDYVELQKVRFGSAFDCRIRVDDSFLEKKLPIFALQAMVENALKHNAFTEEESLTLNIDIVEKRLKVSNNRIPKVLQRKSGTGLKNLIERYKLVTELSIEIHEDQTQFTIYLPLL